jgi:hypothetical protein
VKANIQRAQQVADRGLPIRYPVGIVLGHFVCDTDVAFASAIDRMHRREVVLQSRAIYRGHSNPDWLLQSLWERHFLHPQRAGLYEPYYIQPHDGARIRLQRAFLEGFRRQVELSFPQETDRSDDQLWAVGRHHGLVTPLLDWTLDPYKALHFALRHSAGTQLAVQSGCSIYPRRRLRTTGSGTRIPSPGSTGGISQPGSGRKKASSPDSLIPSSPISSSIFGTGWAIDLPRPV